MFVTSNSFDSLLAHFNDRLSVQFSHSEIRIILLEAVRARLKQPDLSAIDIGNMRFSESDLLFFREVRTRLLNQEPLQYVIGTSHFYGLDLKADKRALIPRPETEELVDWIVKENTNPDEIVDLCSGSGCIGLALKKAFPNSEVRAVELSEEAIELIEENKILTGLEIQVIQADVLNWNNSLIDAESADVIVSNPPYVLESDKAEMKENVLDFEPHLALFVSNADPLIFYKAIASLAKYTLKKGGQLYFEFHEKYAEELIQLMEEEGFVNIEVRKDLQLKDRMLRCVK
jgi:release factor glutamine methyltransferase